MSTKKTESENRLFAIDSGAALNKGVAQVRESQHQSKPQGLSRPSGVIVPPVGQDSDQPTAQNQQSQQNDQKK